MKQLLISLLASMAAVSDATAQGNYPDCTNLLVDSVYISGPDLRVVLSNTCTNCASAGNGALYLEMVVVRRSNPLDTFSRSACYCHMTPHNNGQLAYILPAPVTPLPPPSDLRVVLFSLCNDVPFAVTTGIEVAEEKTSAVFYEPAIGNIHFGNTGKTDYKLINNMGQVVLAGTTYEAAARLDVRAFAPGIYYIEMTERQKRTVHKIAVL